MSRASAALALLLGACGPAGPHPPAAAPAPVQPVEPPREAAEERVAGSRPPTLEERRAIARLERTAERVRQLDFVQPVPIEIENAERISGHLTSQLEPDELERAHVIYSALGLLEPEADLREMLGRLTAEQVVGYYDPEADRLVVRDDVMRALRGDQEGLDGSITLDHARVVLVHELVHALQDQRLGLGGVYDEERDTDPENAFRALVEGDATLAMLSYAASRAGGSIDAITSRPDLLRGMVQSTEALPGAELGSAPPIVRVTMVGSYLHGMVFTAALHRRGGWPTVDRAHEARPVSTEQVMHPEAYFRGEAPVEVTLPAFPALEKAGLEPFEEDTLGELELGVYLGQSGERDVDAEAAAGWGGDRLRVYRGSGGRTAVVWFTCWDSPEEAREAAMAAGRIVEAVPPARRRSHRVERRGRAVLVVRDLEVGLHSPVIRAFRSFADAL